MRQRPLGCKGLTICVAFAYSAAYMTAKKNRYDISSVLRIQSLTKADPDDSCV